MSRAETARLGLETRVHPSGLLGENVRFVGPFSVVFANDRVVSVTFKLTGSRTGILVGGRQIPESASLVIAAMPNCGHPEVREGGVLVQCGDAGTIIKMGSESPGVVELQVIAVGFVRAGE